MSPSGDHGNDLRNERHDGPVRLITISNGLTAKRNTISNINGNLVTLAKPLQYSYTQANGVISYPEPALLMPHPSVRR